ncbi:MAG TPA: YceH family protein [Gaiellaceae bacterium]
MDADAVEIRVLGCLLEKQRTTPDVYPLSLNALRAACNQTTNRDPVVDYDEATIRAALNRLSQRGWARLASGAGSRAVKYRHLLDEALALGEPELAVLGVLMLRGPQTPGELNGRTERLHRFGSLGEIDQALEGLLERELVVRLPRRPGQKEERYQQLLGGAEQDTPAAEADLRDTATTDVGARLRRLEDDVASLRQALASLRAEIDRAVRPESS